MKSIFRIRKNTTGTVRTNLCIEDVEFSDMDVLTGFGLITVDDSLGEDVIVFKEPYRIPRFNKFYASRIKDVNDKYLGEVVERLLYLNPEPDPLMIKKITEYIILNFSAIKIVESDVMPGYDMPKPILKFEQVEVAVKLIANRDTRYEPDNEDSVMFRRNSQIERADKLRLRAFYRASMVKDLLERSIHTVAEHLIDEKEQVKLSDSRIESTQMVTTAKGPASLYTIRKYMSERTRRIMNEHNTSAPFATETTEEKFYCYLSMDADSSLGDICSALDISRSTASYFKKLRKLRKASPYMNLKIES